MRLVVFWVMGPDDPAHNSPIVSDLDSMRPQKRHSYAVHKWPGFKHIKRRRSPEEARFRAVAAKRDVERETLLLRGSEAHKSCRYTSDGHRHAQPSQECSLVGCTAHPDSMSVPDQQVPTQPPCPENPTVQIPTVKSLWNTNLEM